MSYFPNSIAFPLGPYEEYISSEFDWTVHSRATGQWANLTTLTIPPGSWMIGGRAAIKPNNSGTAGNTLLSLAGSIAPTFGAISPESQTDINVGVSTANSVTLEICSVITEPTVTTTYYLNFRANWSDNPPQAKGIFFARRLY